MALVCHINLNEFLCLYHGQKKELSTLFIRVFETLGSTKRQTIEYSNNPFFWLSNFEYISLRVFLFAKCFIGLKTFVVFRIEIGINLRPTVTNIQDCIALA